MKGDAHAIPSAFDDDAGQAGILELVFEVSADGEVFVEFVAVVFATGVLLRAPVFIDGEAEGDRIYFLAHRWWWMRLSER
jgi:hypothetical protein